VDLSLDDGVRARLAQIRELGREHMRPLGLEADRLGRPTPPDHAFFKLLVQLGLGRTRWSGGDTEKGSSAAPAQGGGARSVLVLAEEMSYWDRGVAVSFPGPGLGEPPVLSMGTAEQKARFLEPFQQPDRPRWAAFAMTEPGAGSDVAAIRTSARRDGDGWVLNGAKSFAANASRADWIVVFATVDAALGREGHRAFVVERGAPGLGDFHVEHKMGLKAYESTSFTLKDCRVPAANLLGGDEHYGRRAGFKGAMQSFNATRPAIAAMAVGMGRAALDETLAFAREHGLLRDPRARDRLERVRRKLRAARLLCWRAAWLADEKRPNVLEASMAKAVAPAVALEAAILGMDLLGEVGGRGDHLVEKLFRDVKAMDIVEGTGQIQRIVMARKLVDLPRDRE
jgi:acyl-CoA dehydrogenase